MLESEVNDFTVSCVGPKQLTNIFAVNFGCS